MNTPSMFLAVFTGSKTSPRMLAWQALSEPERRAKEQAGIAAWSAWAEQHRDAIVVAGGPLGKTQRIDEHGIQAASNALCAFMVVRAASHDAAVRLFDGHPHFTSFPGDAVEVMPILPIPGT